MSLTLIVLPHLYAICQLPPDNDVPEWAAGGDLLAVIRTPDELSIVCGQARVPNAVIAERDWRCLKVAGLLDFNLTGVLASLAGPLADASISIFALSTYNTDYLLVRARQLAAATQTLAAAGHVIQQVSDSHAGSM